MKKKAEHYENKTSPLEKKLLEIQEGLEEIGEKMAVNDETIKNCHDEKELKKLETEKTALKVQNEIQNGNLVFTYEKLVDYYYRVNELADAGVIAVNFLSRLREIEKAHLEILDYSVSLPNAGEMYNKILKTYCVPQELNLLYQELRESKINQTCFEAQDYIDVLGEKEFYIKEFDTFVQERIGKWSIFSIDSPSTKAPAIMATTPVMVKKTDWF